MLEPKYDSEFEAQIIGALMIDVDHQKSRECLDLLSNEDFYIGCHKNIFNHIQRMVEHKVDVNFLTVESTMTEHNIDFGGFQYLTNIRRGFISINAIPGYIKKIKKCSSHRQIQQITTNAIQMLSENIEPDEIIEGVSEQLKAINVSDTGRDLQHIKYATGDWLDILDRRAEAGGGILGVSTGIDALDEALGGLDEESLIVVAGAPSMGKTLFTQTLSLNVGVDQKKNVMFFSMEMSSNQLYERFVSGVSNVSPQALRLARFDNEMNGRISTAVDHLDQSGIYYTDEQSLSVAQIRSKVRAHKKKHNDLKMIVVDYLGLIKLGKADRHDIAIGDVTRSLKELAKEIKAPVVLVVQANRANARPNMRNLKDSSCIEADADVVMFVHRHEILEPETELKGITELIIAKDRHNDGNGTVYMEKINGGFKSLTPEQAAMVVAKEEARLNPKKDSGRGFR